MKRIILILFAAALLISFAACKKEKEQTSSTTLTSSTEASTAATQPSTTSSESTTSAKTDISFIYKGYWYKNEGTRVVALKFEKDGNLVLNTYRRKNITTADDAPDSIIYGSYRDNGNGELTVYPDNEFPEEFYTYTADPNTKTLSCLNEDPQASTKPEALKNADKLDKQTARSILLGDN